MSDNYAVINGKRIKLTEEQVEALGVKVEKKRRNPFERVNNDNEYYCIKTNGEVSNYYEVRDSTDNELYDNINYFNDEQFAEQVMLHQLLYRKLLKFAYSNGLEDTAEWDNNNPHWSIRYSTDVEVFKANDNYCFKHQDVYFSSEEAAERAIKEVVEPFVRKYPKFVW
jgi:hypothetical protein